MTAENGIVRMGILGPDNRENYIKFSPEKAREWAAHLIRCAKEAETTHRAK